MEVSWMILNWVVLPHMMEVPAGAIEGPAGVIDGDTLDVAGERVRLHGIDAPEKDQTCTIQGSQWACGIAAWGRLVQLLAGQVVSCDRRDVDQYGRTVGVCQAGGEDINARMVAEGWALAYRAFSLDYVPQEDAARTAGLGLWQGDFVPPWDWRRGDRLDGTCPPGDAGRMCRILHRL